MLFYFIYIYIYIYIKHITEKLMSTFHAQQQYLCHLASTRLKEKSLQPNAVLPHNKTKKQAYPFILN